MLDADDLTLVAKRKALSCVVQVGFPGKCQDVLITYADRVSIGGEHLAGVGNAVKERLRRPAGLPIALQNGLRAVEGLFPYMVTAIRNQVTAGPGEVVGVQGLGKAARASLQLCGVHSDKSNSPRKVSFIIIPPQCDRGRHRRASGRQREQCAWSTEKCSHPT